MTSSRNKIVIALIWAILCSCSVLEAQTLPPPPRKSQNPLDRYPPTLAPDTVSAFLESIIVTALIEARTSTVLQRNFFPVRSKEDAEYFFGTKGISSLENVVVSGWTDKGSVSVEYLKVYGGPIRVGFGALIARTKNSTDTLATTLESFFAGGGNAYFTGALPIVNFGKPAGDARATMYVLPRFSALLPVLGESTDKVHANLDLALETHLSFLSQEEDLHFFLQVRSGLVIGTEDFYSAIGATSDEAKIFFFGQMVLGVRIAGIFNIAYQAPIFGPKWINDRLKGHISVQLVPK